MRFFLYNISFQNRGVPLVEKRKYDKELLDLQRKYEDEQEKIQLDSYEKEKRLLETQHKRDLEDIVNQNKEKQEAIAKVEREISGFEKAKKGASSQAQKNYDAAIQKSKYRQGLQRKFPDAGLLCWAGQRRRQPRNKSQRTGGRRMRRASQTLVYEPAV